MELVAFDLETTGLSPKVDRIIEIGAVRFDDSFRKLGELQLLTDPGIPLPIAVERLTGIAARDLQGQPAPAEGVAQLADFCQGAHLVGHGSAFDITFCAGLLPEVFAKRPVMDTLELARVLLPGAASHSLPILAPALGLGEYRAHRALEDAEVTWKLLQKLTQLASQLPPPTLHSMRRVASQSEWPVRTFLEELMRESSVPAMPAALAGAFSPNAAPMAPAAPEPVRESVPDAAVRLLDASGPMAQRHDYELRESQLEMARAVGQVLERGRHLLVEAGTGTGKTAAYLVPLLLWIQRTGKRAAVATRTITLQEQIFHRELPACSSLTATPDVAVLLKGRRHYLSLRRWRRFLSRPDVSGAKADLDAMRFKLAILVWLTQTKTGDRVELNLGNRESELWRLVESDKDDCLGSHCPNWQSSACHMVRARQNARSAPLIITNHALLLADGDEASILGEIDAVVIDEAHHLEETATEQLGMQLAPLDVQLVVDRLTSGEQNVPAELLHAREAAVRLFGEIKGALREGAGGQASAVMTWGPDTAAEHHLQHLLKSADAAMGAWRDAAAWLREVFAGDDESAEEAELAASALERHAQEVDHFFFAEAGDAVRWLQLRADHGEIHSAPVAVAATLRERLFSLDSTILTSATLAVAGDFGYIRERLGVPGGAEELLLESPFDYLNQALTLTLRDMPPYDLPEYEAAMALVVGRVARRLGGRTLVLFTGYASLRRVHELLADDLENDGIAVLGQGLDGTRRQLLTSFTANPRTVLLGTNSFWEGIDVPGDALQAVIIAKLPFAVPTDPLVGARTAGLRDPFRQYFIPQAAIRLRQGFGRVIRHSSDRAAILLCDERLLSRRFGAEFLAALPHSRVAAVTLEEAGAVAEEWVRSGIAPAGARSAGTTGVARSRPEAEESA